MLMLKCFCEELMSLDPNTDAWCATQCGHMFHYKCLNDWRVRSGTCPQCRKPVNSGQMFRLYPAASEERPKDDVNEDLQKCLDFTNSQLEEMTQSCMDKDGVIASLKVDADNAKNCRQEKEVLKQLLQNCDGISLDELFDDPHRFDEVVKEKVTLMNCCDEFSHENNTPNADTTLTRRSTDAPNATVRNIEKVDKPTRPMSPYMLWLSSSRESIRAKYPGLKVTEFAKKGGEMWRSMQDKDKRFWEEKAARAKEQYKKDLELYNQNQIKN